VTGVLTDAEVAASIQSIRDHQRADGLITWTIGGHADPWNHVEAAMALDTGGAHDEAQRAYEWLVANQLPDGSWHQYYDANGVEDAKFDANTIAYVATGALHHGLSVQDDVWLASVWPTIERALTFVVALQQPTGEVFWALEPDGTPFHYALVTGSSSIHQSLQSAVRVSTRLGLEPSRFEVARTLLHRALELHETEFFAEKNRWAMDWYYPVLGGIHRGVAAQARLRGKWDRFVLGDDGIRCVDDHPWVTTGETAEAAMACVLAGMHDEAVALLQSCARLRYDDGSYYTGLHVPSSAWFPENERTTYSTAAVLLADALLRGDAATVAVFA
jgi:hypothetical protein